MSFALDRFKMQPVAFLKSPNEEAEYYLASRKKDIKQKNLFKIYTLKNRDQEDKINQEIQLQQKARNVTKNVIKIDGCTKQIYVDPLTKMEQTKFIILLEYVSQNLRDVINFKRANDYDGQKNYFTSSEMINLIKDLIRTFADLQRENISHRHIELESIYFLNRVSPQFFVGDFYHAKNLIAQDNSEIRQIDEREIKSQRFPDQRSLECLSRGECEYKSNYYKMDVYNLGIVFIQLAYLEIFETLNQFNTFKDNALESIEQIYGTKVKDFLISMIAQREHRLDFIELEGIMDEELKSEESVDKNIKMSYFPESRINLTENNEFLRDDLTSSSSDNRLYEESLNNINDYSIQESPSLPNKYQSQQQTPKKNIIIKSHKNLKISQPLFQDEQKLKVIEQLNNDMIQKQSLLNNEQLLQNKNYNQERNSFENNNQRNNNSNNQQNRVLYPSNSEKKIINPYDNDLQIPVMNSIYVPNHQIIRPSTDQNDRYGIYPEQSNRIIQRDEYTIDYINRSQSLQNTIQRRLTYQQLIRRSQGLKNLLWFDKKKIRPGTVLGYGSQSEIRQCTTSERNCCVIKMYDAKSNEQVWDMIESLNKFNQVSEKQLVVKIEGYYINPILNDDYSSELWIIQKEKKYNLLTVQKHKNLSFLDRLKIVQSLTQTIQYLHTFQPPIIHGDIKPQNILLDLQLNPFLTDFVVCDSMMEQSQLKRSRNFSTGYSAPEQLNDMQFCKNSDIWSLGNKVDYTTIKRYGLYDPKRQGCLDLVLQNTNESYSIMSNLIKDMTQYNPDNRTSLENILENLEILIIMHSPPQKINQTPLKKNIINVPKQNYIAPQNQYNNIAPQKQQNNIAPQKQQNNVTPLQQQRKPSSQRCQTRASLPSIQPLQIIPHNFPQTSKNKNGKY